MDIKLDGLKELNRALKQLPDKVSKKVLSGAVSSGAGVVRREARKNAPEDSGFLRKHIISRTINKTPVSVTIAIGPSKKAFYGMFHELGTKDIQAHPYLRPALDENKNKIMAKIRDRLWAGIKRESAKLRK